MTSDPGSNLRNGTTYNLRSFNSHLNRIDLNLSDDYDCVKVSSENDSNSSALLKYIDNHHAEKSLHFFNQLRKSNILCDLTIIVDKIEIKCHKIVLASCSPYFYAMFSNDLQEAKLDEILVKDVNSGALEILVNYMYTGEIEINENNVECLLDTSNLLQLTAVKESCCEFLVSQLDISNCIGIRRLADILSCVSLTKQADSYIEQYFCDVIKNEEFSNLTVDQLIDLIKNDHLVVPSEKSVYDAAVIWLNYDIKNRIQYLDEVMDYVRFPLIERIYLENIAEEPLIKKSIKCQELITSVLLYSKPPIKSNNLIDFTFSNVKPRVRLGLPQYLLVIGGQGPKPMSSVDAYDFRLHSWIKKSDLPTKRCRAGVVHLNDLIYVIGGFNGTNRVRSVDVYNLQTNSWSSGVELLCVRSTHNVALLNNRIYAVGGFDGYSGIMSAEAFNPEKNTWTMIANMSCKRSSVGVTALNNYIYAIGGYCGDTRSCLDTVERYDPVEDKWTHIQSMSVKRSGPAVCVFNDKIYVFGGHDGPMIHKSAEFYDSKTNKWEQIAEMNEARRNSSAIIYNGLIYCIGGDDGSLHLSSIEIYNPEHNIWSMMPTFLTVARSYAGVLTIEKSLK